VQASEVGGCDLPSCIEHDVLLLRHCTLTRKDLQMARRYIGDAIIYITYHDDGDYRGSIVVVKEDGPVVWKFKGLHASAIGFGPGVAYDSPEAYDQMARAAVVFGSDPSTNREIAAVIDEATGSAWHDGVYLVNRRR